jgi:hypothetical protein
MNPYDSQINYKNISGDIRFSDNNPVFPFHWATEATNYCIMSPAPPIAASLYLPANNIWKNPAKYPSLSKNPPKYTTAYIVQQSNCRWLCEPTFYFG